MALAIALPAATPAWSSEPVGGGSASGNRLAATARESLATPKKRSPEPARRPPPEGDGRIDRGQRWLSGHGALLSFDVAFYDQYASRVRESSAHDAASFAWQLFADYEVVDWPEHGDLHLTGTFLGTIGADYDPADDSLSARVGAASDLNGNVYPDGFAVDEIYLHYVTRDRDLAVALGKLDMSYFFDTNRVANDAYRQFTSFAFENDLSIPFPVYGGFGVLGRWNATDDLYVMAAASAASSNERIPWRTLGDGSWWELVEAGIDVEPRLLGRGTVRLTGWHSDSGPGNGFGVGLNLDQNLGVDWLIGFLRLGLGDPSQTSIRATASAGVALQAPLRRAGDAIGVGLSWADPAGDRRQETFAEAYYRFAVTRRLSVSPGLQIVVHPADNAAVDVSVVGGLRLLWAL